MAGESRKVELAWLPQGAKATGADFAAGETWTVLDDAIVHAKESMRADGKKPWIRCDGKFVLSPEDIAAAYSSVKGEG